MPLLEKEAKKFKFQWLVMELSSLRERYRKTIMASFMVEIRILDSRFSGILLVKTGVTEPGFKIMPSLKTH